MTFCLHICYTFHDSLDFSPSAMASSGRVSDSGNQKPGVRYLPPPCCVVEQRHIYSPESTGNTQEGVTLSQYDGKIVDWDIKH